MLLFLFQDESNMAKTVQWVGERRKDKEGNGVNDSFCMYVDMAWKKGDGMHVCVYEWSKVKDVYNWGPAAIVSGAASSW